jgi:hypothetical protein
MPGGEEGDHRIEVVTVDRARGPGSHVIYMGATAVRYIMIPRTPKACHKPVNAILGGFGDPMGTGG